MSTDAELTCIDCGEIYLFSADDQNYYRSKGYSSPVRCRPCRKAHKALKEAAAQQGASPQASEDINTTESVPSAQTGYPAICSKCGHPTTVPFEPRGDRPITCRDCYRRDGGGKTAGAQAARTSSGDKVMYPATCAGCGQPTEVPFMPRGDKPVYCRDCFRARRNGGERANHSGAN